jgi:type I restriction enzyme S subunit
MYPTQQLRRLARIKNGSDHSQVQDDFGEFPVYGSGGEFTKASRPLYSGPSVLLGRKGTIDRPLLVNGEFWTVDTMFCAQPYPNVNPTFLYYACTTIPFELLSTSTALPSMTQGDLNAVRLPTPDAETQRLIAEFLDRETAKIDALIDKQEQLIATLREDRAATITHAVTKGLDPSTQHRQSRTLWLGPIPHHWKTLKLSRAFQFLNGDRGASYPSREDIKAAGTPFINAGHLKDGKVDFTNMDYISREKYESMGGAKLRSGDILYCLRGSIGKNALIENLTDGALASSLVAMRVRNKAEVDSAFIYWQMNSFVESAQREILASGTAQPNLAADDLANFIFSLPPLSEQIEISAYLAATCLKIDKLTTKSTEMIATLREYRSALITNVVMGKIDVREAV